MFSKLRSLARTPSPRRHAKADNEAELDLKTATHHAPAQEPAVSEAAPPSYQDSNQTTVANTTDTTLSTPPFALTFVSIPPPPHPIAIHMQGDYRTPNFSVALPSTPDGPTHAPIPLFEIDTDSTLIFHHSHIRDLRAGGIMHTLKRTTIPTSNPTLKPDITTRKRTSSSSALATTTGPQTETYRYTIHAPGASGAKLLEITTTPDLLTSSSTKLIFRDHASGELDAVTLRLFSHPSLPSPQMTVLHQNAVVGRMSLLSKESEPALKLDCAADVDPLLLVVLVLVVDDRWMTQRRRLKREFGTGVLGVGKGPGAGLAGAYALGGV
jgi:hypothetical protein